jgi:hypothetical protein
MRLIVVRLQVPVIQVVERHIQDNVAVGRRDQNAGHVIGTAGLTCIDKLEVHGVPIDAVEAADAFADTVRAAIPVPIGSPLFSAWVARTYGDSHALRLTQSCYT